ncbi:hypothetical protein [Streptomyces sp. NPDC050535]|uniref:hypothetical protein n=1 Tax=Streptomyces sp. NPDC050535 TaxID=3365626 RepID=UPI0037BC7AB8
MRHPVMIPIGSRWDKALSPGVPPSQSMSLSARNGFDAPHEEAESTYEQADSGLAGWVPVPVRRRTAMEG